MHLLLRLIIALALLLPGILPAQSVTVLRNSWVVLSDAEIEALGFDAKLAVDSSGDSDARLTIVLPDSIEGKKFIDAQTRLLSNEMLVRSFAATTTKDDAGNHMIRFNVDLMLVTTVKLRLRYTGNAKYEATIRLDGYQTVI